MKIQADLKGKVALVTGASKGIGEAIVRDFAACGARVVVSSRKQEAVDAVAASIVEDGGEAVGIAAKIGEEGAAAELIKATCDHFGGVDILVNNAAANPVFGPALKTDRSAFDKIMDVNLRGPFELAQAAFGSMKARGGGSIINISSVGGISPEPGLGIYSVSKAGLISLTKVLAKELGAFGIRCNVICPGLIQTKFSEALWKDEKILSQIEHQLPLKRMGQPHEISGICVYLASDAGSYATGAVFPVDGGFTI